MDYSRNNIKAAIFLPIYCNYILDIQNDLSKTSKISDGFFIKFKALSLLRYPISNEAKVFIKTELDNFFKSLSPPTVSPILFRRIFNFYEANHFAQSYELKYYLNKSTGYSIAHFQKLIELEDIIMDRFVSIPSENGS